MNVWVALTLEGHVHNPIAARWLDGVGPDSRIVFCRITQLSLLRLLTTRAVMGSEVMNQEEAWRVYDSWVEDSRVVFLDEPAGLEPTFRKHTQRGESFAKDWTDSYLIAFALESGLTLVSFDLGFRGKIRDLLLLTT